MAFSKTYDGDEPQRINKWLAQAGVCSRREAEGLIAQGLVAIDGEIVTDAGRKIAPGQTLRLADAARARLGEGWVINGSERNRYPGNLNIRRTGLDVARLLSDLRDIAFSAGSACASGSGRASHVLRALGLSEAEARSSIRLGFGRYTRREDLEMAIDRIVAAADAQAAFA